MQKKLNLFRITYVKTKCMTFNIQQPLYTDLLPKNHRQPCVHINKKKFKYTQMYTHMRIQSF